MQTFGIGELVRRSGVAASTIRYYEQIGLLPPSRRVNTKRRYDSSIMRKLDVIGLAKRAGFKINEIQGLLHDFPADTPPADRWQAFAEQKMVELQAQMRQLEAMRSLLSQTLVCDCASIDECPEAVEIQAADVY
jgi:MerR family transcriptional regulator, redox-sensitive transcriptional activator SoxR